MDPERQLHSRAMILKRDGKITEALELLYEGIRLYPGNVFFPFSAAGLVGHTDSVEEARRLFEAAVLLAPRDSKTLQVNLVKRGW